MPTQPDVSVLIATYNCAGFVGTCIDAVRLTTGRSFEIIVADNASSDGTPKTLRAGYPDVEVVEMGGNTGFARATNAALHAASGRFAVMLNPDTEVQPGALDRLVEFLENDPRCGVAAPRLLNSDLTDQGTARSFPTPAAALLGRRSPITRMFPQNRWSRRYLSGLAHTGDEPFEVDWVSGACLATRTELARSLGGLDEGFFMHWEDADYCHRVKDAGYRVYCVRGSEVVHHEGGSRRGWPRSQVVYFHRGAYRYWTKHHAPQRWNPLRPLAAAALGTRAGVIVARNALVAP